jgi:ubiquinone/menaquinone biosynthesis C-methylase UbiE
MSRGRNEHPLFARFYASVSPAMDRSGGAELREKLLSGLTGEVIEIGAGNGLNFAHYPGGVTRVLAVEPEPRLREIGQANARLAPVPIEVVAGVAERLPAEDASFDAAVASLVLCSVSDLPGVLRELHRVVRPGGELRFLEHVRAQTPALTRVQRTLDATIWPALFGGCHVARDTAAAIEDAGFAIEDLDRFSFPETRIQLPTSPTILGTASRGQP